MNVAADARAALLLVDLQRDFLAHPGLVPDAGTLTGNIARLLAAFRAAGLPVAHARTLVRADVDDRMPHWRRDNLWRCVEGTPGAAPPAELEARADEPILAKTFYSPFQNRSGDAGPRARVLVVAGVHAHACVRATVLDAYQRGYEVWVAADGVASYDPAHAALSRDHLEGRACRFLTMAEIARRLNLSLGDPAPGASPREPVHAGGGWRASGSGRVWRQHNPADHAELLYTVAIGDADDVDLAARRARERQRHWADEAADQGPARLRAWADALAGRRAAMVAALTREIGKPVADAEAEFDYALGLLAAAAGRAGARAPERIADGVEVMRRPLGVVGLITPWNNPLAIPVGKIAPALAYGNTVLWKPAPPGLGIVDHVLASLAEAGFPEDCVNVVIGDAETGQAVVRHADVAAISFTGSVAAGRAIAGLCALSGKPLQAELGGNNGVVIGACRDPARAAAELASAAFSFSGQRCTAPRRLIVTRDRYDDFLALFLARVGELRLGHPADPETRVGPLLSRQRRDEVLARVEAALSRGGELLRGGGIPAHAGQGCWLEPTVIAPADAGDAIVREESFGPVVVVLRADDFEAAVALCNDVEQGLVASLYSDDEDQLRHFSRHARAGILRINDAGRGIHPEAPFGGWKASGMGPPEHGRWDESFYCRPQAVYRAAPARPARQPEGAPWKN